MEKVRPLCPHLQSQHRSPEVKCDFAAGIYGIAAFSHSANPFLENLYVDDWPYTGFVDCTVRNAFAFCQEHGICFQSMCTHFVFRQTYLELMYCSLVFSSQKSAHLLINELVLFPICY